MKAHIVCIIDRSGSMGAIKDDAIGGFNSFLEEQRKQGGDAVMTYVQFDTEYEKVFERLALSRVKPLDGNTYVPRGGTALLDAVGRTINEIGGGCPKCGKSDEKVIVAILTDGHENSSREFRREAIKKLIDGKREAGWEFIYLGANQDSFAEAGQLGIRAGDTFNFAATGKGVRDAYATLSNTVTDYRSGH